jgi:tetratricopeptide (TPR) repeat protein
LRWGKLGLFSGRENDLSEHGDRDNVIRVGFGEDGKLTRAATPEPTPTQPAPPRTDPRQGLYAVAEVARLFGYKPSRLRYWHRSGLLGPSARVEGRNYYRFRDLVEVRVAKSLLDQGVSLQQVRLSVQSLRRSFPETTRPLSELRVLGYGGTVVVQDEEGTYEPSTGQAVFDFRLDGLESDVIRLLHFDHDDRSRAYAHYLEGCRYDEDEETYEQAEQAYRKALSLDPTLSNALTNLGNLEYRRDQPVAAEQYYRRALAEDPEQPEALYNLGFLHFERDEVDEAIELFRSALASDPSFADAHFNLAMALEERGDRGEARPHWQRYLELEPDGAWAELAGKHLQRGVDP